MSNDTNLPRPNIPQPPSAVQSGLTQTPPVAVTVPSPNPAPPTLATLASGLSSNLSSNSNSASTQTSQTPVLPQTAPSGLDSQFPAGPPPELNDEGQVLSTSTISQTIQPPSYDQPQAPAQSVMQKMHSSIGTLAQSQPTPGLASTQSPINPAASPDPADSDEAKISLTAQTTIAPTHRANEPVGTDNSTDSTLKPEITNTGLATSGIGSSQKGTEFKAKETASKEDNSKNNTAKKRAKMAAKGLVIAKPKFRLPKIVPFLLLGLLVVAGVIYGLTSILGNKTNKTAKTTGSESTTSSSGQGSAPAKSNIVLSYWGLWEPDTVFQEVLQDFEKDTGISVDYRQQSHQDYRTRLQAAIDSGSGPDVFRFHGTWVSMLKDQLAPMPAKTYSLSEYQKAFYPIFAEQLQINGQLVGIPLMYDGLALYYNKDILQTANEEPPSNWGEVRTLADKLTVRTNNEIERGGIALGNTSNVEHYADILGLLIYQNGGDPANPLSGEVRDAIK
ncbi:MAG TPA: extracellular solute-binding protein, partial [Candidatus Woesebacteria bacterium]|nr:extracellular solute-binding protein [Candidatus Woesebacteria bacterium]